MADSPHVKCPNWGPEGGPHTPVVLCAACLKPQPDLHVVSEGQAVVDGKVWELQELYKLGEKWDGLCRIVPPGKSNG